VTGKTLVYLLASDSDSPCPRSAKFAISVMHLKNMTGGSSANTKRSGRTLSLTKFSPSWSTTYRMKAPAVWGTQTKIDKKHTRRTKS